MTVPSVTVSIALARSLGTARLVKLILKKLWWMALAVVFGLAAILFVVALELLPGGALLRQWLRGEGTVADRLAQFGPAARERWRPYFERRGVSYPPQRLLLLGLKREQQLEIYAANEGLPLQPIRSVSIQRLSG